MKKIIKQLMPPIILSSIKSIRNKYGYFGGYKSWKEAIKVAGGYNQANILEKVTDAARVVQSGKAVYERDSALFDTQDYAWPLLAALFRVAVKEGKLDVIDFGGSLGSAFFQNKLFLNCIKNLRWNIVEQPHFVKRGRELAGDPRLFYYNSIKDCLAATNVSAIVFSSSLQYLEEPYSILDLVLRLGIKNIIFDRTTFNEGEADQVCLQRVPPQLYEASYPCWFFNKSRLVNYLSDKYLVSAEFEALGGKISEHGIEGFYGGLIFEQR